MRGSIYLICFFILGLGCGRMGWIPLEQYADNFSFYAVCALMACVGISVGNNPFVWQQFKSLNPRMALLPLATAIGTWGGCLFAALFLHYTPTDCMVIGSGFGYYSLASVLTTELKGAELGTLSLVSNMLREIITLLGTPLFVRLLGHIVPISIGGATSVGTSLPILTRYCGEAYVVLAVYHGFVISFSVPLLVSLFGSL